MQEVTQKIDELYSLLVEKNKIADKKIASSNKQLEEINAAQKKLEATQNQNAATLRKIKKYKDFEAEKIKVQEIAKKANDDITMADTRLSELSVKISGIDKKEKDLDKMIGIYKTKTENIAEEKKQLAEDRKKMKDKILDELKKKI